MSDKILTTRYLLQLINHSLFFLRFYFTNLFSQHKIKFAILRDFETFVQLVLSIRDLYSAILQYGHKIASHFRENHDHKQIEEKEENQNKIVPFIIELTAVFNDAIYDLMELHDVLTASLRIYLNWLPINLIMHPEQSRIQMSFSGRLRENFLWIMSDFLWLYLSLIKITQIQTDIRRLSAHVSEKEVKRRISLEENKRPTIEEEKKEQNIIDSLRSSIIFKFKKLNQHYLEATPIILDSILLLQTLFVGEDLPQSVFGVFGILDSIFYLWIVD